MGTILADFTHIAGVNGAVHQTVQVNETAMSSTFNTGGIRGERSVLLMFSVVPSTGTAQADVFVNDHLVGSILATQQNVFTTHTIAIARAQDVEFKSTDGRDNVFEIRNVPRVFTIKDVVCFFHQES